MTRHRVLVAAQPAAWVRLRQLLGEAAELVAVHTRSDACDVLKDSASSIDLIICTVAFDDSQMIVFVEAVKREPGLRDIPFLCVRALPSVLSDNVVSSVSAACRESGAVDFIDLAKLDRQAAEALINTTVRAYVGGGEHTFSESRTRPD